MATNVANIWMSTGKFLLFGNKIYHIVVGGWGDVGNYPCQLYSLQISSEKSVHRIVNKEVDLKI